MQLLQLLHCFEPQCSFCAAVVTATVPDFALQAYGSSFGVVVGLVTLHEAHQMDDQVQLCHGGYCSPGTAGLGVTCKPRQ